ncbi:MAG: hypothetical protein ABSA96_12800 [Candidatus Acidiferrales bacterium]
MALAPVTYAFIFVDGTVLSIVFIVWKLRGGAANSSIKMDVWILGSIALGIAIYLKDPQHAHVRQSTTIVLVIAWLVLMGLALYNDVD